MNMNNLYRIALHPRRIREQGGKKVESLTTKGRAHPEALAYQELVAFFKHYGLGKKMATQVFRFYYLAVCRRETLAPS